MSKLRLEQLFSNLSYASGSLVASGSFTIVDNITIPLSASFNTSGSINVDVIDGGTY
jgi:hypothetical protein